MGARDIRGAKTFDDIVAFFDGILGRHREHIPGEDVRELPYAYYRFGGDFVLLVQSGEKNFGKSMAGLSLPLVVVVANDAGELTLWRRNVYTGRPEKITRKLKEITGPFVKSLQALSGGSVYDVDKLFDNSDVLDEFYAHYTRTIEYLLEQVKGLDSADKKRFVVTLVNRFIFLWFLQQKGLLDGDTNYLINKFRQYGNGNFYQEFINDLFFFGLNKEEPARSPEVTQKLGRIRYLNGGLFRPRKYEGDYDGISYEPNTILKVPDEVFFREMKYPIEDRERTIPIFNLLDSKDWTTDESDPDVLKISPKIMGYIFEKNINALEGGQKDSGAYYTPDEFTFYLCEKTIYPRLLKKAELAYENMDDALARGTSDELLALFKALQGIRVLDSAVGSGHFPLDALSIIEKVYDALRTKGIHSLTRREVREHIITENLHGVDIMAGAVEVCQLRMFLAIAETFTSIEDIEPLPNIDYNVMEGNSLIGYVREDVLRELQMGGDVVPAAANGGSKTDNGEKLASLDLRGKQMALTTYTGERVSEIYALARKAMDDAEKAKQRYRHSHDPEEACKCRVKIETTLKPYRELLNKRLFNEFLNIKDKKTALTDADVKGLKPFHWIVEFAKVMSEGGFDVVVGNPPWNKWKPNSQEFFEQYDPAFRRLNKQEAERRMKELCSDDVIASGWDQYNKGIKLASDYFRTSERFKDQSAKIMGRTTAGDLNLYKLFMEADFGFLQNSGYLGLLVPSGFYTDAGCKGLRNLYLGQSAIKSLYCFENRKGIFKEIHKSFKFITIVTEKGKITRGFRSGFMLQDKAELGNLDQSTIVYPIDAISRFSPYAGSIMELKNQYDISIARKMYVMPVLGEMVEGKWSVKLTREFDMTNDSDIFNLIGNGFPLYEGKMIHQYNAFFVKPRYHITESSGRERLNCAEADMDYLRYRICYRNIARNTDSRSIIAAILPKNVFIGHTANYVTSKASNREILFLMAVMNSFSLDYIARNKITIHLDNFYVYEFPVPRFIDGDPWFSDIVTRAAKLTCNTPGFDELAAEAGIDSHLNGVTDEQERQKLKNEIDAMAAKIYGLTREELVHILSTFPIVAREHPEVIPGVLAAYDRLTERGSFD
jgi:hypothetical protein